MSEPPLLRVQGLRKSYVSYRREGARMRRRVAHALVDVDLSVQAGECLALVGESGGGKTTLARCLPRLLEPDAGTVLFHGRDVGELRGAELRRVRRRMQLVFQDPAAALDPRLRVSESLVRAITAGPRGGAEEAARAADLLESMGLAPEFLGRYPHQLSGGQRRRVTLARALAAEPDLLILDEPVAALDPPLRRQISERVDDHRRRLGLGVLWIGHDLSTAADVADRVAVLYLGRIVEQGPVSEVFEDPRHPYTRALVAAVPPERPDPDFLDGPLLEGEVPSPETPPSGCVFHPRCGSATEVCRSRIPGVESEGARTFACHHPLRGSENRHKGTDIG